MRKTITTIVAVMLLANLSFAQTEAEAKAWQEFMTPGSMHKWMAKQAGNWEGEMSNWMGPGDPVKSKATESCKMIMNGLYLVSDFSSTMMGMPFTGQSITAYDNAKKMFIVTWIDNFGSGIIMMTGQYNEQTKTLELKGKQTDPVTGKDTDIRQVNVYHNDDSYTTSMYGTGPDGKEMKFMEGLIKRKK